MTEIVRDVLAILAVIILAMAFSGTSDGAKLVQLGLILAIIAVVLKNSNAVQDAARNLTNMVTPAPHQSRSTGGN